MCPWWFTSITLRHFNVHLTFSNFMVCAPWDWRWVWCERHCLSFVSKLKQEGNSCWKGVSCTHTQGGGFLCLFIYFKNPLKYFSEHPRIKGLWSHQDASRGRLPLGGQTLKFPLQTRKQLSVSVSQHWAAALAATLITVGLLWTSEQHTRKTKTRVGNAQKAIPL